MAVLCSSNLSAIRMDSSLLLLLYLRASGASLAQSAEC
jgi:hypothetical protein